MCIRVFILLFKKINLKNVNLGINMQHKSFASILSKLSEKKEKNQQAPPEPTPENVPSFAVKFDPIEHPNVIYYIGPTGPEGEPGKDGQSIIGPRGPPGPVGRIGPTGLQGVTGPTGPLGPTGCQGVPGTAVNTGATGPNGLDGRDGYHGVDGLDGYDGLNGRDGRDGRDGIDGLNGIDGINGKDGASAYFYAATLENPALIGCNVPYIFPECLTYTYGSLVKIFVSFAGESLNCGSNLIYTVRLLRDGEPVGDRFVYKWDQAPNVPFYSSYMWILREQKQSYFTIELSTNSTSDDETIMIQNFSISAHCME
jgi:hypothetical protein